MPTAKDIHKERTQGSMRGGSPSSSQRLTVVGFLALYRWCIGSFGTLSFRATGSIHFFNIETIGLERFHVAGGSVFQGDPARGVFRAAIRKKRGLKIFR